MFKSSLSPEQKEPAVKSNVQIVDEAETWARALTKSQSRCAGDYGEAMRRAARAAGVTYSLFWCLHYKKPKDVWASAYLKIKAAYDSERERQMRKVINGARRAKESGADPALVRQALALVDIEMEDLNDE